MGSESYTEKRWKENIFLLLLFIGLIFLSFSFLKEKSGLTAEETSAYFIANTFDTLGASHLISQSPKKDFSNASVPNFIQSYYNLRKTSFSVSDTPQDINHFFSYPVWHNADYYTNYLIPEKNGSFDYHSVIENCNTYGTAPLYYLAFHTVSSMFPFYSIKYVGFVLNLICVLGIFFVIFYICRKFLNSVPAGFAACILFCFSIGTISALLCTQNYLMTVFFMLLSCSLHLGLLHDNADNVWNLRFLVVVTILGTLTDYYFLAFALLEGILYLIAMLGFSQYKNILKYLVGMLLSGVIVFALFPAVFSHISTYVSDILASMHSNTFGNTVVSYFSAIQNYLLIRGNLCFAFLFLLVIVCMLALVLNTQAFSVHWEHFKNRVSDMEVNDIFLILLFFIHIGMLILFRTTCSIRLFLGLLPFAAILICYFLYRFCNVFMKSNFQIGLFIGAIVSIVCFLSLFYNEPDFLQKENKETITLANTYADTPCVFVANEISDAYPYLLELGIQKKSIITRADNRTTLSSDSAIKNSKQLLLCLNTQEAADSIVADFLSYGKYAFSKPIYDAHNGLGHMQIYLLYR